VEVSEDSSNNKSDSQFCNRRKKGFWDIKNNPKCICETTIATNMSFESSLMKIPFF
jgi:hypothetical protein